MKKIFTLTTVCCILLVAACSKEAAVPAVPANTASAITTNHYIGEHFGGGIIFYINKGGQHGIIAAEDDLEEPAVWAYTDTITNAIAANPGTGAMNTQRIFQVQGDPVDAPEDYAALEIREYAVNGFSDWFLPSKDELNEMFLHKDVIGRFKPYAYWSSTEVNISKAWFQNFGNGLQVKSSKIYSYGLRPVRYF